LAWTPGRHLLLTPGTGLSLLHRPVARAPSLPKPTLPLPQPTIISGRSHIPTPRIPPVARCFTPWPPSTSPPRSLPAALSPPTILRITNAPLNRLASHSATRLNQPLASCQRRHCSFSSSHAPDTKSRFSPAGPSHDAQASPLARNKATPPCRKLVAARPSALPSLFSNPLPNPGPDRLRLFAAHLLSG
jgi:hypothetical protein